MESGWLMKLKSGYKVILTDLDKCIEKILVLMLLQKY